MKNIIWILVGFSLFAGLVAIIFVILNVIDPIEQDQNIPQGKAQNDSILVSDAATDTTDMVDSLMIIPKITIEDSLREEIRIRDSILVSKQSLIDSMSQVLAVKTSTIKQDKNQIELLKKQILKDVDQQKAIKELAKTYEGIKTSKLSPILKNLDDVTIMNLYRNMSSRTRKNIITALPDVRAALITKKLAGK